MQVHANAKLGLAGRPAVALAVEDGASLRAAAARFGVSPQTARKWFGRRLVWGRMAAAGAMRNNGGGSNVNVTSRLAVAGVATTAIYSASKGALLSLTRAAAIELAPFDIRVNAVAPGMTDTPLYQAYLDRRPDPETFARRSTHPFPRAASPAPRTPDGGYTAA